MFGYEKKENCTVFTRPDGKTIIFNDDGTIIGTSGKQLKNRPSDMGEICYSIAANGRLSDTKNFINKYYKAYCIYTYRDMDKDFENMVERIFKVIINNVYCSYGTRSNVAKIVSNCYTKTRVLCRMMLRQGISEKEMIKFLNETRSVDNYYNIMESFNKWYLSSLFWSKLPQIDYPEYLIDICNNFLSDIQKITDEVINYLKTGIKNHQIENLYFFTKANHFIAPKSTVVEWLLTYYNNCELLNEVPSLSGNFIAKVAEISRKIDARKDMIFAKKQNKRNLVFEDNHFIVVVPQTVAELIEEGKAQNNCVGSYGYDDKVVDEKCNIVFIRRKDDINNSYITCEINKDGEIIQYLEAHNRHVINKQAQDFSEEYQKYLNSIWQTFSSGAALKRAAPFARQNWLPLF